MKTNHCLDAKRNQPEIKTYSLLTDFKKKGVLNSTAIFVCMLRNYLGICERIVVLPLKF